MGACPRNRQFTGKVFISTRQQFSHRAAFCAHTQDVVASRENVHIAIGTIRGWAYALYGLVVGNARTQRPSAHLASSNDPRLAWAEDAVAANVG